MKPKHLDFLERAFLKDEFQKKQDFLDKATREYHGMLPGTLQSFSFFDKLRVSKLQNDTAERLRSQTKQANDKTVEWLINSQLGEGILNHSTIFNLAGIELSDKQKEVLCRELNFGLSPRLNCVAIEAKFEFCWNQLADMPAGKEAKKEC